MKKDPQAMAEYNKYKLDQWRTDKAQQQMEADAWIKDNSSAIIQAIKEEDFDELDNIINGAGEFSGAAQTYASNIISAEKTMQQFEENSMLNKAAPDTSVEEEQISSLPEELQKMVKPSMLKYKKLVEEGWDENTKTWKTGYRVRAEAAQKEVQGLYRNIINQIATSEYFADVKATRDKEETIKELELELEAPVDPVQIRLYAEAFKKDRKKPITQSDLNAAEEYLRRERDRGIIRQLESLDPERTPEENSEATIETKVSMARQNGQSDSKIRKALEEDGHTDEEINKVLGRAENDVSYMSPEYTSADRAYIERVRSKISPMGTYTNG